MARIMFVFGIYCKIDKILKSYYSTPDNLNQNAKKLNALEGIN